jgi:hypothetical protein
LVETLQSFLEQVLRVKLGESKDIGFAIGKISCQAFFADTVAAGQAVAGPNSIA